MLAARAMIMDSEIVDDCKEEIQQSRRAATRGVFLGATIAVAVLFVPWDSFASGVTIDAIAALVAVGVAIVAAISATWPDLWACIIVCVLHLQPWLSRECFQSIFSCSST
jgi:hypothetical protein